jgi:hypothetical protein
MKVVEHRVLIGNLFLVIAFCIAAGCGGGGSNGSNGGVGISSSSSSAMSRQALRLYTECMSTTPINASDPKQPVITLKGARVVNQPVNSIYVDAGAMAADPADGDISNKIQTLGLDTVDTTKVGDYLIRYEVSNTANVPAAEVVRIIRVNSGTFAAQTARDMETTGAHMGYYEHLPVNYSDVANQKFPLIIFQHGYSHARFLDPYTQQVPLSTLEEENLVKLIKQGQWDNSRPFIVLSFQKCIDDLVFGDTARRAKLFIDYAINAYQVDPSRIYMMGHSQGAGDTWDYVINYPNQLAAIVPIAGYYGDQSGCTLKDTPAWAFNGELDTVVDYHQVVTTVNSINACQPLERAKVTVFNGLSHNDIQDPILSLSGLGAGLSQYDIYNQNIYDWLLQHQAF